MLYIICVVETSVNVMCGKSEVIPFNAEATTTKGAWGGLMNHNIYATKKTVAQGMLDVALLTANASQLKYLLQVGTQHEFYHLMLVLISLSIALQIIVGFMFLVLGTLNVNLEKQQRAADILNNVATGAVFLITALNIIISSFGMHHTDNIVFSPIV
ncbi:ninjurin-2-like isoform X2 [Ornithodoros turicata]|uniref:ninjurin-2-like isoform X2 n=1 Tax=Ornithodoros turicata TaxID=34597 RepID=UPI00313901FA